MKITFEVEITGEDAMRLWQNSIERVLNNAIYCGLECQDASDEGLSERGSSLWQDCEELKPLVNKLWWAAQEALRKTKITDFEDNRLL